MEAKKAIRAQVKQRISQLTPEQKSSSDICVVSHLKSMVRSYRSVASYQALQDEVSLMGLQESCPNVTWVYPKVDLEKLRFYQCQSSDDFEEGAFGVLEPCRDADSEVALAACDAVLVPGRAFDRRGQRLGRGRSYYDRVLKEFEGQKVGVCYSQQVWEEDLPVQAWDVAMDVVVTEKYILQPVRK